MRAGHPYLEETQQRFMPILAARVRTLGRPARIFEIGCASGVLTRLMLDAFPDAEIVAGEELPELAALARQALAGTRARLFAAPFARWEQPVDVLVSAGSHHHLPHDYLEHAFSIVAPGGCYVMADELCPEYLHGEHAERLARGELVHVAGGHVLVTAREVAAFHADGTLPAAAIAAERLRKRALWRWYRFVVDHAIERDYIDIAIAELKSAHDDLITGSDDEHKYAPSIFERQAALAGFVLHGKHVVGPADPALQSFFIYELGRP